MLENLPSHAAGVQAAGVHDVGDALGPRDVAQGVVGMAHPADGEDDDGGLVGDAVVGVGAVVVLIGADPVKVGEAQGVDEGLVVCGVGDAADEGEGAAFEEGACFLHVAELERNGSLCFRVWERVIRPRLRRWGLFSCRYG